MPGFDADPTQQPAARVASPPRRRRLRVLIIGALAVCGAAAVFWPMFQSLRESPRREQCSRNLAAISRALQQYHDTHKVFPPAYVLDANGGRGHSWRVLILRELGYESLYARYRFDEPWDGQHNRELIGEMPHEYGCPSNA